MSELKMKTGMFEIMIEIETKSSCLIGNQTESFSVGGVDQATTVDENGRPIIDGSAFKGSFRNIIRENDQSEEYMPQTKKYLKKIFSDMLIKYQEIPKTPKVSELVKKIEKYEKDPKAEYLFGIEGLNSMPRLFCTDFRVWDEAEADSYFRIETKNSLREKNGDIESLPRTYRVVKPGVVFEGKLRFRDPYFDGEVNFDMIKSELKEELEKFNEGFYGIGNSKSRGYGNISVTSK